MTSNFLKPHVIVGNYVARNDLSFGIGTVQSTLCLVIIADNCTLLMRWLMAPADACMAPSSCGMIRPARLLPISSLSPIAVTAVT